MWLVVEPARRAKTHRIMAALAAGFQRKGRICVGPPPSPGGFVVWGHRWTSEAIIPPAMESGADWWLIDNGFHMSARGSATGYYSITFRGMAPTPLKHPDPRRLPISFEPWRTRKRGHVLITFPGEHCGKMMRLGVQEWKDTIESKVRAVTDRKIIVRKKGIDRPLSADMESAYCIVTAYSKTSIDAVRLGIPCVVDPANAAAAVCVTDLAQINRLRRPPRADWWSSLMCQQFTLAEMAHGVAFKWMKTIKADAVEREDNDAEKSEREDHRLLEGQGNQMA